LIPANDSGALQHANNARNSAAVSVFLIRITGQCHMPADARL
jgi:hypothetical protein